MKASHHQGGGTVLQRWRHGIGDRLISQLTGNTIFDLVQVALHFTQEGAFRWITIPALLHDSVAIIVKDGQLFRTETWKGIQNG